MKLASLRESFTNSRYSLWHCFAFAHNVVCIEKLKMKATNWSCNTICTFFGSVFTQVFLPNRWIPTVSAQNIVSFDFNWRQLLAQMLFTNARNVKFILHICWLEGNIHVFLLKSMLETKTLFGHNVFFTRHDIVQLLRMLKITSIGNKFWKRLLQVHTVTFPPMRNFEFCCMQTHKSISFSQL